MNVNYNYTCNFLNAKPQVKLGNCTNRVINKEAVEYKLV